MSFAYQHGPRRMKLDNFARGLENGPSPKTELYPVSVQCCMRTNLRLVRLCIKTRRTKIEKLKDEYENWQETHKKAYNFSKNVHAFS
jgi:hypothetical protein